MNMSNDQERRMARVRKKAPSRERAYKMQRIALSLCLDHVEPFPEGCTDCNDAAFLLEMSEFLLDVRQAFRGGAREVGSGRGR